MTEPSDRGLLAELLRSFREARGMTQVQLAEATGLKREYISGIELGRIHVVYPEAFGRLKAQLGFDGWLALEAMGYGTDRGDAVGELAGVGAQLLAAVAGLTQSQQRALVRFLVAMSVGGADSHGQSPAVSAWRKGQTQ